MTGENPKKIWFRAKTYGWGWVPVTWQGWFVLLFYVVAVFISSLKILGGEETGIAGTKQFILTTCILTAFLLHTCYTHGEKPGWRWGKKDTDDTKDH